MRNRDKTLGLLTRFLAVAGLAGFSLLAFGDADEAATRAAFARAFERARTSPNDPELGRKMKEDVRAVLEQERAQLAQASGTPTATPSVSPSSPAAPLSGPPLNDSEIPTEVTFGKGGISRTTKRLAQPAFGTVPIPASSPVQEMVFPQTHKKH